MQRVITGNVKLYKGLRFRIREEAPYIPVGNKVGDIYELWIPQPFGRWYCKALTIRKGIMPSSFWTIADLMNDGVIEFLENYPKPNGRTDYLAWKKD